MSKNLHKENKYLRINAVKEMKRSSLSQKKETSFHKVSDQELAENIYHWDPYLRQFIRTKRYQEI